MKKNLGFARSEKELDKEYERMGGRLETFDEIYEFINETEPPMKKKKTTRKKKNKKREISKEDQKILDIERNKLINLSLDTYFEENPVKGGDLTWTERN